MAGLVAMLLLGGLLASFDSGAVSAQDATPVPATSSTSSTPNSTSGIVPTGDQVTAAEQQLADKYAPIAMLKAQTSDCDKSGEGYFPVSVDFLFDNPDIALKAKGDGSPSDDVVIKQGITPQDLVTAGENTYLDFPGNPRDPKCEYETYFKEKAKELGLEPTVYVAFHTDEANGLLRDKLF